MIKTAIGKLLIALALLVVVFTVGYDFGSDRERSKQLEKFTQAQADSKDEVLKSQNESIAIESRVDNSNQRIESIKDDAARRLVANEPKVVTKTVTVYRCLNDDANANENSEATVSSQTESRRWAFDNGTVRLLNKARTNDSNSTANVSDVTDSEPSNIGVAELVENDLDVVARYHELSERHKSLQTFITDKQNDGMMFCKQE